MTPQQILEKITIGHVGIDTDDISLGKLASILSDLTNRIEKLEGSKHRPCDDVCTNGKDTYHEWNTKYGGSCSCGWVKEEKKDDN